MKDYFILATKEILKGEGLKSLSVRNIADRGQRLGIVAAVVAGCRPRTAGIFPLGLRGQPVALALLLAKPLAEGHGVVPTHAVHRVVGVVALVGLLAAFMYSVHRPVDGSTLAFFEFIPSDFVHNLGVAAMVVMGVAALAAQAPLPPSWYPAAQAAWTQIPAPLSW